MFSHYTTIWWEVTIGQVSNIFPTKPNYNVENSSPFALPPEALMLLAFSRVLALGAVDKIILL